MSSTYQFWQALVIAALPNGSRLALAGILHGLMFSFLRNVTVWLETPFFLNTRNAANHRLRARPGRWYELTYSLSYFTQRSVQKPKAMLVIGQFHGLTASFQQ